MSARFRLYVFFIQSFWEHNLSRKQPNSFSWSKLSSQLICNFLFLSVVSITGNHDKNITVVVSMETFGCLCFQLVELHGEVWPTWNNSVETLHYCSHLNASFLSNVWKCIVWRTVVRCWIVITGSMSVTSCSRWFLWFWRTVVWNSLYACGLFQVPSSFKSNSWYSLWISWKLNSQPWPPDVWLVMTPAEELWYRRHHGEASHSRDTISNHSAAHDQKKKFF